MNKKIIWGIVIVIIIILVLFLPIFNGRVICGFNPEKGCWNDKINLIDYIKDINQISPVITDIYPMSGPVGTTVTLKGNGFDSSKTKDGRATYLYISGPYRDSADERHGGLMEESINDNLITFKIPEDLLFGKHFVSISNMNKQKPDSNKVEFEVTVSTSTYK